MLEVYVQEHDYPGWVGGGFKSVVTLRLSQPSLAGVGAGAELGKS